MNDSKRRILIVDDDKAWVDSLREYVDEATGIEAHCEESAESAYSYLSAHPVNLIITDTNMGTMSGLDLLAAAKSKNPFTVVIVFFEGLRGTSLKKDDVEKLGADHVLKKSELVSHMPKILKDLILRDIL